MAPGSIFHHINPPTLSYFCCFLFCFYFTLHLYHKNTKNNILSYLSDLTLVSDRVGIDNPLSRWLRGFICLCRCEGLVRGLLLDWYLGSQKLREILILLCCITHSSSTENQCNAQEVARRISINDDDDFPHREGSSPGIIAPPEGKSAPAQVPPQDGGALPRKSSPYFF